MDKLTVSEKMLPDPYNKAVRSSCLRAAEVCGLYIYMAGTACFHTREEFKSFNLTDAYNYFPNGKVSGFGALKA